MRPIRETYNASGPRNTHARATPKSSNSLLKSLRTYCAVVGGELFLYVLARNVDDYFEKYDDEVQDFLKKSGYKGLLLKPRKNNQDNCPAVIYEPNAFDPSTPPPVLA